MDKFITIAVVVFVLITMICSFWRALTGRSRQGRSGHCCGCGLSDKCSSVRKSEDNGGDKGSKSGGCC